MLVALIVAATVWLVIPVPRGGPGRPGPGERGGAVGPDPMGVALIMDLLAAALQAGATLIDALEVVAGSGAAAGADDLARVAGRLRTMDDPAAAWDGCHPELEPLRRVVDLIVTAGVPASGLLRDAAADLRRRSARRAQIEAARLGVRLVLPLGLCALPAFIAWSVVPVVLTLARDLL